MIPDPISPREVTVLVQGAPSPETRALLAAARHHLPGAQLLLSTWRGADVASLDADEVILNEDPGSLPGWHVDGRPGPEINCNRMIRSTLAGLRRADRPYTVKLRTDCALEHGAVLQLLAELPVVTGEWALFERAIGVSSVYTRHPDKLPAGLFHPADTTQFGQTSDLLTLWDAPFMTAADAEYFLDDPDASAWALTAARYLNEQHVFIAALSRRYRVDWPAKTVRSAELTEVSNRALAQNFVVVEPWTSGLRLPRLEQHLRWHEDPTCAMTAPIWQQLHLEATRVPRTRPWG